MLWPKFLEQIAQLTAEQFFVEQAYPVLISTLPHLESEKFSLVDSTRLDLLRNSKISNSEVIKLYKSKITIGRGPSCDITLSSMKISRQHIVLNRQNSFNISWVLVDCCARNGTQLNGEKVGSGQPYSLEDGAIIDLSTDVRLIFRTPMGLWKTIKEQKKEQVIYDTQSFLRSSTSSGH